MAHPEDMNEIERIILNDPKALHFSVSLHTSMTFKSCKIGSVPLGLKVT